MNRFITTQEWFYTLSNAKKIKFCIAVGLMVLGASFSGWYTFTPTYAVLFSHLEASDANQVIRQLDKEHIYYRMQNNGQDILVERSLIHATRLKLMDSNTLDLSGSTGFELFDKNDFGMTDFSQKINYQRALQGELERTISSLDEIRQARVHLVIPERHLFQQEEQSPKAAVTVYLKKPITKKQIKSIQRLIASSVNQLKLNHVVIVDQYGNTLSQHASIPNTFSLHTKKVIEHDLVEKAMHALKAVYPHDAIVVNVNATLNYDALQRERITPQSQGQTTHEKEVKHPVIGKTKNKTHYQEITREKSYQLGTEKELFQKARGTIERLSIGVILPDNTDSETLKKIHDLIKNSVGFDAQRGDTMSIAALIHANPAALKKMTPTQVINGATKHRDWVLMIALILTVSGVVSIPTTLYFKALRNNKRHLLLTELNQWLAEHE